MARSQNPPRRHHYIPEVISRNFTAENGTLWYRERGWDAKKVVPAKPDDVFREDHLYTQILEDGTKDIALEQFFSKMESTGGYFIGQLCEIVRKGNTPRLNDDAWDFWYRFWYYTIKRTPGYINAIAKHADFENLLSQSVAEFAIEYPDVAAVEGVDSLRQRLHKNAIVIAQGKAPNSDMISTMERLGLSIYCITDPSKSFIIGDVFGATARIGWPIASALTGREVFVPLAHDVAVGTLDKQKEVQVFRVDRNQVRRMNEATAESCEKIAGRSPELLVSLTNATIFKGVPRANSAAKVAI